MIFKAALSDPEKIKQTLAKAYRNCQEMELAPNPARRNYH